MTTSVTAVEQHGITIEEFKLPAGTPLRALCLCGWASPLVGSRPEAEAAGAEHTAPLEGQESAPRADRRAEAVAAALHCAPWCAYQDDPDFFAGEAGNCLGEWLRSPVSIDQGENARGDLVDDEPDFVSTYPVRRPA